MSLSSLSQGGVEIDLNRILDDDDESSQHIKIRENLEPQGAEEQKTMQTKTEDVEFPTYDESTMGKNSVLETKKSNKNQEISSSKASRRRLDDDQTRNLTKHC